MEKRERRILAPSAGETPACVGFGAGVHRRKRGMGRRDGIVRDGGERPAGAVNFTSTIREGTSMVPMLPSGDAASCVPWFPRGGWIRGTDLSCPELSRDRNVRDGIWRLAARCRPSGNWDKRAKNRRKWRMDCIWMKMSHFFAHLSPMERERPPYLCRVFQESGPGRRAMAGKHTFFWFP